MYVFIFLVLVIILIWIVTNKYFSMIVTRKTDEEESMYEQQVKRELIDKEWYLSLPKEYITLISHDGLKLKGEFIDNNSDKTMIFVHGITVSRIWSIKYIKMFYNRGWNILLYDQRRHGKSEGSFSTYGYYEKLDLDLWVNFVVEKKGKDSIIGIHGESMGAATALQYISINKYADFIIEDCGFSSLKELLMRKVKSTSIFLYPFYYFASLKAKLRAKFTFSSIKPIDIVEESKIPIMFIHGDKDDFVPWDMSVRMYETKKYGEKSLYIAKGAAHARAIEVDPETYEKEIFKFVDEVISSIEVKV